MKEIQISRDTSNIIKGASCLLIVLHHFCSWLDGKGYSNEIIHFIGFRGGVIGVTIFFFLSAWGLSESQNKKQYSFGIFAIRRLSKIYIPLIVSNFLFYFFLLYYKPMPIKLSSLILATFNLKIYDLALWFCNTILIFYLIFYISFLPKRKWIKIFICLVATVLYSIIVTYIFPNDPFYVYSIIGFPFGMILSLNKDTMLGFKKWGLWCFSTLLILLLGSLLFSSYQKLFLMNAYSLILLVILVAFIHRFTFSKRLFILPFMGTFSYEIYLLHYKVLIPLGRSGYILWYPLAFLLMVIPLSILLKRFTDLILNRYVYQNLK